MATYNSNIVPSDPDQYFQLDVSFNGEQFTWTVTPFLRSGSTGDVPRCSIYGLTVRIGGNQYYKGNIDWRNYFVGNVVYSGTTQLSACTVTNGTVAVGLSGNFWHDTWDTTLTCTISGSEATVLPTVDALEFITNKYRNQTVAGVSRMSISVIATPGVSGDTITDYKIYFDGSLVATTQSTEFVIPPGATHTFYAEVTESNGVKGTSPVHTIDNCLAYTPPAFVSISSVRWSTGDNTGVASDDGEYAKLTATFTDSKVGTENYGSACKVKIGTHTIGTINTSGGSVYSGQILNPNQSYTVIYELYDSSTMSTFVATSELAPIVASDIITIGGRGIDLIHTGSDYGVAVGMKATAGYLDTAYPLRVNTIDSQGNVTAQAVITATSGDGTSLYTFTKTNSSSTANMTSFAIYKWGRVVQVVLHLTNANYASAGAVMWGGEITSANNISGIMPLDTSTGSAANGANNCFATLTAGTNKVTLNVFAGSGGYQSNWTANVAITYIV